MSSMILPDIASDVNEQSRTQLKSKRGLNKTTLVFYSYILKLSKQYGYCWATNRYLSSPKRSNICGYFQKGHEGCCESQTRWRIQTLISKGWMRAEYEDGERRLYPLVEDPLAVPQQLPAPPRKKMPLILVPASEVSQNASESLPDQQRKSTKVTAKVSQNDSESQHPLTIEEFPGEKIELHTDTGEKGAALSTETKAKLSFQSVVVESPIVSEMKSIGVWHWMAKKVAQEMSDHEIRQILADPKLRAAREPAKWFAKVTRDGYHPPSIPAPSFIGTKRYIDLALLDEPERAASVQAMKEANPGLSQRGIAMLKIRSMDKTHRRPAATSLVTCL